MKSITPVVIATCALATPVATQGMKSEPDEAGFTVAMTEHQRDIPILLRPMPVSSFELLDVPHYVEDSAQKSSETRWIMLRNSEVLTF